MKISRKFTKPNEDVFATVEYEKRTSRISNPDGSTVFEMTDAEIPKAWSQLATDIMVSKYFRKAGVPQADAGGNITTGPERSARQVIHRLAGCWRHWGEKHNYFDSSQDAQAFYDELSHMLLHQMCAPNSPQWFNTGLNWAYNITGPSQGHFFCDPETGQTQKSKDAYTHPQPHACQPYDALVSTPQGPIKIGDIVNRGLVGLEVYDGTRQGTGTAKVLAVKANGDKPVFRIILKNGLSVEATADHRVWAVSERRVAGEWLEVAKLVPGQRLQLSTVTSVTKNSDEAEVVECALAGWLQGDGFVGQYTDGTNRSLTLEFMTVDEDEHQHVMQHIARAFEGVHFKVRMAQVQDSRLTVRRIRLYGERLRPFVEKYELLRKGADHAVPGAVCRAGLSAQCAYLRSLFQADGTVRRRTRSGSRTSDVVLTTISPKLAAGVQALLLNLGIYARVQPGVEKRNDRRTPLFVSIGYAESRAKFQKLINFVSLTKQQKMQASCSDEFPGKQLPALREEVITRIELTGTRPVFDIQTESGQYLSNNVIVHNCFIQSVNDDLVNPGGIMDLWTREARLFKYGSGTGTNFSRLRGDNEPLSGGGKSSGLMSFLKIGDRAAGAIKSGGTTRRAAKMVCLDLDHPDIEQFVNWKVREELKVAALAEGIKHLPQDQQAIATQLGLHLDYDFNGEAYFTVSGQNSNNSVRIPNSFFKALEKDSDWNLTWRTNGKVAHTLKARDLWSQIAFAAWRSADPGVQFDDTINQWHTCPRSGPIRASNPCVTGDTRILTPGGIWRRIDQMIHLPSRVITNFRNHDIHVTDGSFPTGTRETFELRTAGGYTVKLTADHKLQTRSRGWVEAQHLTCDDELHLPAQPATVREIGEPQDPRFFQLLGLFISDANNDASCIRLETCLADPCACDEFANYVSQTWGDRAYADDYIDHSMLDAVGHDDSAPTLTAAVTHRRLISRMKAFVRTDAGQRRLSDDAFTAGLAAQRHLLRGLFTADAFITGSNIELNSPSLGLLQDVQLLLLGFGIQSSLTSPRSGRPAGVEDSRNEGARLSSDTHPDPSGALPDRQVRTMPLGPRDATALSAADGDATQIRHGLRIDSGSLRAFGQHIGLLPGRKLDQLQTAVSYAVVRIDGCGNWDAFASLTPLGRQQVFDLTEPQTHSFIAGGITVHNCSEYMFLDDTACNLASLNVLTFFDSESRTFDIDAFRHAVRLWTIVLEISVLMASFPSEEIAALSYRFRTLGLGYANLGALLMQSGIPYDSDKGRAVCAALTAILTGESYAASAEMAAQLGTFPGYEQNKSDMLRVMRNHRRAAWGVSAPVSSPLSTLNSLGSYESLDIPPVPIDASQFSDSHPLVNRQLLSAAQECWDRALFLGEQHGFRNAQTTVIAPTGTIGLLMDCDTTGVEPDFALVKFKKLAGGGYFKIANQSVRPALVNLGYTPDQVHDILRYVMGTLTLHDAPYINWQSLKALGFTEDDLRRIEDSLLGQFELSFAFTGWTLGPELMARLEIPPAVWQAPNFNLLKKLGFTRKQIDEANDRICGLGTVEGAPHLRPEHYPVFDCANKCGRHGQRYIAADGHIRMMAAAQPFISGAISKTINLPHEATVADIQSSYRLSWELGLKANALYRDGSKLSQPLNVKSDADLDAAESDDELNVESALDEVSELVASASSLTTTNSQLPTISSDNLEPTHIKVVEKIIERIVERPLRRRLPDTRHAITHKFDVAGHEGYITAGLYADGQPGEVFITMAKEGSTIGGLMDAVATLVSVSLQYGVPVESLVRKFEHVRFEPAGMTRNADIPMAKSLVDYIFRWLAMEFVPGYRSANAPTRTDLDPDSGDMNPPQLSASAASSSTASAPPRVPQRSPHPASAPNLRLASVASPLNQQGSEMQADAPACDVCGSITVRSGTCYKCLNCGNSMGCS